MSRPSSIAAAFALVLLCIGVSPSHATLIVSGPGLTPCEEGQCVDVRWDWRESPAASMDEAALVLPIPDPEQWVLSSGWMSSSGEGSAGAIFHSEDIPEHGFAGSARFHFEGLGADGALLIERPLPLTGVCHPDDHPQPTIGCGDGNGMSGGIPIYYAITNDLSFQGPLTLRYSYSTNWYAEPISEHSRFWWSGGVHLVYTAIPEPSGGVLLTINLIGVAGWLRKRRPPYTFRTATSPSKPCTATRPPFVATSTE